MLVWEIWAQSYIVDYKGKVEKSAKMREQVSSLLKTHGTVNPHEFQTVIGYWQLY